MKALILICTTLLSAQFASANVAEKEMSLNSIAEQLNVTETELVEAWDIHQGEKIFVSNENDHMNLSFVDSLLGEEAEWRRGDRRRGPRHRRPRHRHRRFPRHRRYPRRGYCPWGTIRVKLGPVRVCVRVGR